MSRRYKLTELNPQFLRWDGREGIADAIKFDCPEGHKDCTHTVPFTPDLDGAPRTSPQDNGAHWKRSGDTFETLTLAPSIACRGWCQWHGFIRQGNIEFCSDSR